MGKYIGILGLVFCLSALPCTTFFVSSGEDCAVGKSYDWHRGNGLVMVNKRGVRKESLSLSFGGNAKWTSRYGSTTFNQHGLEFPLGGMNEKGLVVEIMWLDASQYPPPDSRPKINELQWIQYQLDSYASVAEVLAQANDIRVKDVYAPVHYMVCDKAKECATFEYIAKRLVIHTGNSLPAKALTNDTYDNSVAYLKKFDGFGGTETVPPSGVSSLDRFVVATSLVKNATAADASTVFSILDSVHHKNYTKFNIAYDIDAGSVSFRTADDTNIRYFEPLLFDYSCATPVKVFDVTERTYGNVTSKFVRYTYDLNWKNIQASMAGNPLLALLGRLLADYPDSTECVAP